MTLKLRLSCLTQSPSLPKPRPEQDAGLCMLLSCQQLVLHELSSPNADSLSFASNHNGTVIPE